jgi:hypothetical protein
MTIGKLSALTVGLIGAVGLGIAIDRTIIIPRDTTMASPRSGTVARASETSRARAAAVPRVTTETRAESKVRAHVAAISTSAPQLHERLKPVLSRGTRMELAADGFRDAEQFATVAHAARNTGVPFVVLKHRVLNDGQTLANAIRASKPELDAKREVSRARSAARSDLEAIAG